MTNNVRIGIIGAGFWALENHLPVLFARQDVEVVGVCRPGMPELEAIQKKYSIPFITEKYEELIALKNLDGVVISSPHHLHFEHASASLMRNLHVLCEKPMTLRSSEARQLVELAASQNRHFLIPYGWNYTSFAAKARELVRSGAIGRVEHILCHMASELRDLFSGESVSWADHALFQPEGATWSDPKTGGGFAHGQLTHALGLLFWIVDLSPREVFCFASASPTGADLSDAICCRFEGGATGSLGGSGTMPKDSIYQVDIRLFGSEGMLLLDIERPRLELRRNDGHREIFFTDGTPGAYECTKPIHRFIDLIAGKSLENCSPATLGATVVGVLDAASRSSRSGQAEKV